MSVSAPFTKNEEFPRSRVQLLLLLIVLTTSNAYPTCIQTSRALTTSDTTTIHGYKYTNGVMIHSNISIYIILTTTPGANSEFKLSFNYGQKSARCPVFVGEGRFNGCLFSDQLETINMDMQLRPSSTFSRSLPPSTSIVVGLTLAGCCDISLTLSNCVERWIINPLKDGPYISVGGVIKHTRHPLGYKPNCGDKTQQPEYFDEKFLISGPMRCNEARQLSYGFPEKKDYRFQSQDVGPCCQCDSPDLPGWERSRECCPCAFSSTEPTLGRTPPTRRAVIKTTTAPETTPKTCRAVFGLIEGVSCTPAILSGIAPFRH